MSGRESALQAWIEILAISLSVIVAVELHKLARARWPIRSSASATADVSAGIDRLPDGSPRGR